MRHLLSAVVILVLASISGPAFAKSRIKDIVEFEGVRTNSLVGYGVVDVSPDPRAEAGLYRNSPDITTLVLADSAHCHNMASSRYRLWRRLLDWAAAVTCRS